MRQGLITQEEKGLDAHDKAAAAAAAAEQPARPEPPRGRPKVGHCPRFHHQEHAALFGICSKEPPGPSGKPPPKPTQAELLFSSDAWYHPERGGLLREEDEEEARRRPCEEARRGEMGSEGPSESTATW